MVNMETVEELAESIADSIGIYGCGCSDTDANGFGNHPESCNCRICFVESMKERIVQAVHNDIFLANTKEISKLNDRKNNGMHEKLLYKIWVYFDIRRGIT